MKDKKRVEVKGTVESFIEDAKSDAEGLKEEMEEWRDNMGQNAGLMATSKYETIDQTANDLDSGCNELDGITVPDSLGEIEITTTVWRPYGKQAPSRADRMGEVSCLLNEAKDALEGIDPEEFLKGKAEGTELENLKTELEADRDELVSAIDSALSTFESCEFPGMFG